MSTPNTIVFRSILNDKPTKPLTRTNVGNEAEALKDALFAWEITMCWRNGRAHTDRSEMRHRHTGEVMKFLGWKR